MSRLVEPFRLAVHAVVIRDDAVLLGCRQNTGFADGYYCFPAGHVEPGETLQVALRREFKEETGGKIPLRRKIPPYISAEHLKDYETDLDDPRRFRPYMDFFFRVRHYHGKIQNQEPEKCSDLRFFPLDNLPKMWPLARQVLHLMRMPGPHFIQYGWGNPAYKKWQERQAELSASAQPQRAFVVAK